MQSFEKDGVLWAHRFVFAFFVLGLLFLTSCSSDLNQADSSGLNPEDSVGIGDNSGPSGGDDPGNAIGDDPLVSQDNLVFNGSFEEGHGLGDNTWGLYKDLPGWYADLQVVDAPIEVQTGQTGGLLPSDGNAKIELDSHDKDGFTRSDARVYQLIDTEVGAQYEVSLDYSPRTKNNEHSNFVWVLIDGKEMKKLRSKTIGWITTKFIFRATNNETRLEFRAKRDRDTLGGFIDNVILKKVAE